MKLNGTRSFVCVDAMRVKRQGVNARGWCQQLWLRFGEKKFWRSEELCRLCHMPAKLNMASNGYRQSGYKNESSALCYEEVRCIVADFESTGREVRADHDQAGWNGLTMSVDWMLKNFCLVVDVSSLLEVITGRGELTECSKLMCFAKRGLNMVPGGSGQWDWRSVSAAVRHWRRTCQVQSRLGKGWNRPNTTYPNSKEEEKPVGRNHVELRNMRHGTSLADRAWCRSGNLKKNGAPVSIEKWTVIELFRPGSVMFSVRASVSF